MKRRINHRIRRNHLATDAVEHSPNALLSDLQDLFARRILVRHLALLQRQHCTNQQSRIECASSVVRLPPSSPSAIAFAYAGFTPRSATSQRGDKQRHQGGVTVFDW